MQKITFVIGSLKYSGAEKVLLMLLNEFAKREMDVNVLLTGTDVVPEELNPKIPWDNVLVTGNSITRPMKRILKLRKKLKQASPNLVVAFGNINAFDVIPATFFTQIPVITCERNDPKADPKSKIQRLRRWFTYNFSEGFIFQTKEIRQFFPKRIQNRSAIIPNPIVIGEFDTVLGEKNKEIVSVGRLDNNQKNQLLLINTFADLSKEFPDYKLIIYGEGDDRKLYESEIKKLNMESLIFLPGRVSNPIQYIKNSEIFVLTSNYEGMPNALIEAMSIGLPCVSTDCSGGGAKSIIKNNLNGILVEKDNKEALTSAIRSLLKDKEHAISMGKNAMKVRQDLSLDNIVKMWIDYIENVRRNNFD